MPSDEHRSSKRYPELEHFESRKEAQAVLHAWQKKLMKMPRFWLALIAYTAGTGLLVSLVLISLRPWFRLPQSMFGGIVGGITGGSGTVMLTWSWRRRCRRYLRAQLIERGIPICLKCGYDLRGQVDPRCPECGTPCDPRLITAANEERPD